MSRTINPEDQMSSSGFFITFKPLDFLDKYVVVGEVVDGFEKLNEASKSDGHIKILNSGKLDMMDI